MCYMRKIGIRLTPLPPSAPNLANGALPGGGGRFLCPFYVLLVRFTRGGRMRGERGWGGSGRGAVD